MTATDHSVTASDRTQHITQEACCRTAQTCTQESAKPVRVGSGGRQRDLLDDAVQVGGGLGLHVHADDVSTRLGKVRHPLLRLHDHLCIPPQLSQHDFPQTCSMSCEHEAP